MSEKRFRVFKYPDSKNYGVSDDFAEYTIAQFSNIIEAEWLCSFMNNIYDENKQLRKRLMICEDKIKGLMK